MSYHISDHGTRLEAEVGSLREAIDWLRIAGSNEIGHETLNEIGQAINRVGCVLHNIGSVIPTLDTGDIETIQTSVERMRVAVSRASDNYKILVERAVNYYVVQLEVRLGELISEKEFTEENNRVAEEDFT